MAARPGGGRVIRRAWRRVPADDRFNLVFLAVLLGIVGALYAFGLVP